MTPRSWRWVVLGAVIGLAVPVSFAAAAVLSDNGIPLIVRGPDTMNILTSIALTEIFLGPLGILIVGYGAGLRRAIGWIAYLVISIPALAVVWFIGVATLSGALGSPF